MSMAPGWYPDPFSSGYLRWWDGERWAPQTVLSAPTSASQAPTPPPGASWPGAPPAGYSGYGGSVVGTAVAPFPLASWGSRFGARLLDTLITGVLILPVAVALMWTPLQDFVNALPKNGQPASAQALSDFYGRVVLRVLLVTLVSVVVGFVYEVPQLVAYGRTVGKRALGIRVRPLAEDRLPTWKESTIRWGVSAGGSLVGGVLFTALDDLFPLWDKPWQQAIHDKAAKTVVVPNRS
jgi:uncharacterized RDD family membrane protein YckC